MSQKGTVLVNERGWLSVVQDSRADKPVFFLLQPARLRLTHTEGYYHSKTEDTFDRIHSDNLELHSNNLAIIGPLTWHNTRSADPGSVHSRMKRINLVKELVRTTFQLNQEADLVPSDTFAFYAAETYEDGTAPLLPDDARMLLASAWYQRFANRRLTKRKQRSGATDAEDKKRRVGRPQASKAKASKPKSIPRRAAGNAGSKGGIGAMPPPKKASAPLKRPADAVTQVAERRTSPLLLETLRSELDRDNSPAMDTSAMLPMSFPDRAESNDRMRGSRAGSESHQEERQSLRAYAGPAPAPSSIDALSVRERPSSHSW